MLQRTIRGIRLNAVGGVLLIGILLRLWDFIGGRSLWLDEAMVALDIIHLSPSELLGPLYFDQIAPAGWLLLEKACLYLWQNVDFALRLPSLVGGIAALFVFYRFLRYATDAWETLAGLTMLALFPVFIEYTSMVKPYILDVLFSVALLYVSFALLRAPGGRFRLTLLYAAIGVLCILLSFGGTFAMAGTGIVLFAASALRKQLPWSLSLAAVGVFWGALFWATYHFAYAHNSGTITSMTGVHWTDSFAPLPTSLHDLKWYSSTAAGTASFLMSSSNVQLAAIVWIYGMVQLFRREHWLALLLISPVVATLVASMAGAYPFNTRLVLGLAPALLVPLACGAVGIVRRFAYPKVAALAMTALLFISPLKAVAVAAGQAPPFPIEEIKPNLAYLQRHYREGDRLFLYPWAEPAFVLYAKRYGLLDKDYAVLTRSRLDPSCIYDDVRMTRGRPRAWLLFSHVLRKYEPSVNFLREALRESGSLTLANWETGSSLYLYAAKSGADATPLPPAAARCDRPLKGKDFLDRTVQRMRSRTARQ